MRGRNGPFGPSRPRSEPAGVCLFTAHATVESSAHGGGAVPKEQFREVDRGSRVEVHSPRAEVSPAAPRQRSSAGRRRLRPQLQLLQLQPATCAPGKISAPMGSSWRSALGPSAGGSLTSSELKILITPDAPDGTRALQFGQTRLVLSHRSRQPLWNRWPHFVTTG
jgi:hypothetical protein